VSSREGEELPEENGNTCSGVKVDLSLRKEVTHSVAMGVQLSGEWD
jgi:hypothetical protein